MKPILTKIRLILILLAFTFSQNPGYCFYIYKAKSKSTLIKERMSDELPGFRYDRNYIELGEKIPLDLLLNQEAKIVKVEVSGAEGIGISIDSNTLKKKGLKIYKTSELRVSAKSQKVSPLKEDQINSNTVEFNLAKPQNQSQIIEGSDFKVFKIFVKANLSGSYTLKATVDGANSATTVVFTRPDFRLEIVDPSFIVPGIETTLTLKGKGLDAFTRISFNDPNIEVRDITGLDDATLKITIFANENTTYGFRDITVSNRHLGKSSTLINGLLVTSSSFGTNVLDPDQAMGLNGMDGTSGMDGANGMGICNDSDATLMVSTITLSPSNIASVLFDPVSCLITFGIPAGFNGSDGGMGTTGANGFNTLTASSDEPAGVNCTNGGKKVQAGLDINLNNMLDPLEVTNTSFVCNGTNGANGTNGTNGTNGLNSLVSVTNESAGVNCTNGGKKVESGVDSNNNNVLDPSEVSQTNYVCNGTNGTNGTNGCEGEHQAQRSSSWRGPRRSCRLQHY